MRETGPLRLTDGADTLQAVCLSKLRLEFHGQRALFMLSEGIAKTQGGVQSLQTSRNLIPWHTKGGAKDAEAGRITLGKEFGFKPVLWEVQRRVAPAHPLNKLPLMEWWCDGTLLRWTLQDGWFRSVETSTVTEVM